MFQVWASAVAPSGRRLAEVGRVAWPGAMAAPADPSYAGHHFPAEVIGHALWLYFRPPLRLRHVDGAPVPRAYGAPRDFLRPRTRHNRHVPVDRRQPLLLRRTATVLALLEAA